MSLCSIILTGCNGRLGRAVADLAVSRGHVVVGIDAAPAHGRPHPVVVDDLRHPPAIHRAFERLHTLTGKAPDAVVHLAASRSVHDARTRPLAYFDNNIAGTIALLRTMREAGVGRLVHGSSAAVYGDGASGALDEDAPPICDDPYARTVAFVEQLIGEVCATDPGLRAVSLRHFDPVGAHPSGRIGDCVGGGVNDTLQAICQVVDGVRECVPIYGDDWPTADGTCARDYLHVMDAARAYADAVDALSDDARDVDGGHMAMNIGSGRSVGALQLLGAFEAASGLRIPYRVLARRIGDVAEVYADTRRAADWLVWRAESGVDAICRDVWRRLSMRAERAPSPAFQVEAGAAPK